MAVRASGPAAMPARTPPTSRTTPSCWHALDGLPPERRGARYVCVLALALPTTPVRGRAVAAHVHPGNLPRPHRHRAARDGRLRLRPDLRARVGAPGRSDPGPLDAGREARDLPSGTRRATDGAAPRRARVLSADDPDPAPVRVLRGQSRLGPAPHGARPRGRGRARGTGDRRRLRRRPGRLDGRPGRRRARGRRRGDRHHPAPAGRSRAGPPRRRRRWSSSRRSTSARPRWPASRTASSPCPAASGRSRSSPKSRRGRNWACTPSRSACSATATTGVRCSRWLDRAVAEGFVRDDHAAFLTEDPDLATLLGALRGLVAAGATAGGPARPDRRAAGRRARPTGSATASASASRPGVPPGSGNSWPAMARIASMSGSWPSPYWVSSGCTSGKLDDDADHRVVAGLVQGRGEGRELVGRQVRPDGRPDRLEQVRQLPEQAAARGRLLAQGRQDLLLPGGPREVGSRPWPCGRGRRRAPRCRSGGGGPP